MEATGPVSYTHLDVYKRQKLYNEAKYLEPPIPFKSFVRYVSKHLPREVQVTLMTKEIENLDELERVLDILQSINDREMGRRSIQPNTSNHNNNNNEFNRPRPYYNHTGNKYHVRNDLQTPGGWSCSSCRKENCANMQHCYYCKTPRSNQTKQFVPANRGAPSLSLIHI